MNDVSTIIIIQSKLFQRYLIWQKTSCVTASSINDKNDALKVSEQIRRWFQFVRGCHWRGHSPCFWWWQRPARRQWRRPAVWPTVAGLVVDWKKQPVFVTGTWAQGLDLQPGAAVSLPSGVQWLAWWRFSCGFGRSLSTNNVTHTIMNSSNKRRSRAKAQSNCVQNREIKKNKKIYSFVTMPFSWSSVPL